MKARNEKPVIIAGGGIGGLAAALALARKGFRSVVLEQAPQFGEIGAGIQLAPNAWHALDALGLAIAAGYRWLRAGRLPDWALPFGIFYAATGIAGFAASFLVVSPETWREFAEKLGAPVLVGKGLNHFTMVVTLADPGSPLGRAALNMLA